MNQYKYTNAHFIIKCTGRSAFHIGVRLDVFTTHKYMLF